MCGAGKLGDCTALCGVVRGCDVLESTRKHPAVLVAVMLVAIVVEGTRPNPMRRPNPGLDPAPHFILMILSLGFP